MISYTFYGNIIFVLVYGFSNKYNLYKLIEYINKVDYYYIEVIKLNLHFKI